MGKSSLGRAQPSWLREDDVPAGLVARMGEGSPMRGGRGHRLADAVRVPEDKNIIGTVSTLVTRMQSVWSQASIRKTNSTRAGRRSP